MCNVKAVANLFSIVIPTWNRLEKLLRAVDSVVQQTVQEWELIVVEDGSDNQEEILNRLSLFNDPRIRIIRLDNHHNAAYARNRGIESATGEWIAFLDSDDYFTTDKLLTIKEVIEQERLPLNTIIYSQYHKIANGNEQIAPPRGIMENERVGDYLFANGGSIGTPGIVMNREFASEIRFDPQCIKHQDYDLLLRAEQAGAKFRFIKKPLWTREYRMSGNHVGGQHLPSYSCSWYNQHADCLSNSAGLGFLYQHVFDPLVQRGRWMTLMDIVRILRERNIPGGSIYRLLATLLPYSLYLRVKAAHQRVRLYESI